MKREKRKQRGKCDGEVKKDHGKIEGKSVHRE
jgi:hypothetical protein